MTRTDAHSDLLAAAKTWDQPGETIAQANARIHDGVPDDEAALAARANRYATNVLSLFPIDIPTGANVMEIGSGTGYIMQAMERLLISDGKPAMLIEGLDIAGHMLAKASTRIGERRPFAFSLYDGVTVPKPDGHYDLIYSVAALQHVPKPYVYNLLFEIKRLLKPDGFAVINLLSWDNMRSQEAVISWRHETTAQIQRADTHWHHFYSVDELQAVLWATGFAYADIKTAGSMWFCAGERAPTLPVGFDPTGYLQHNPDVAAAGMDAGEHWRRYGHGEGRRWR